MKKTNLEVVYRKTADLIPYVNNARTHSEEQVTQIAASIKEFGFNNPILVDGENGVIAGHGRLLGAKKLGLEEVPTIELKGLTEAQKKAYILADNKIALNSGWDYDLLKVEMDGLKDLDIDLTLTGFSEEEVESLIDRNDTSYLDELTEEGFSTVAGSSDHDTFTRSLVFNVEDREVIDKLFREKTVQWVSERVLELAKEEA